MYLSTGNFQSQNAFFPPIWVLKKEESTQGVVFQWNVWHFWENDVRDCGCKDNISAPLLALLDRFDRAAHRIKTCALHLHELTYHFATALIVITMNYAFVLLPRKYCNLSFLSNDFKTAWNETICLSFELLLEWHHRIMSQKIVLDCFTTLSDCLW